MKEKKLNKGALIGVVGFNSSIGLGALISLYALLACFWILTLTAIACPGIMIFAGLIKIQAVTALRIFLAVLLSSVGVELFPIALKLSRHLIQLTKQYLNLNKKILYR
ncbi:HAAS domain-containing protein [Carnobacterium gallinarum]|uniref:HAAS domain-containing protein n=1 Tax=Carnobacterium gallinarum TaxID=2749 RepID=UPI000558DE28|nr:DUF1700 domain-containing protein [Carnobacterium gallinarum]